MARLPGTYKVKRGDTLSKIASQFYGDDGMIGEIARLNEITDPNRIRAGNTLQLPGAPEAPIPRARPPTAPPEQPQAAAAAAPAEATPARSASDEASAFLSELRAGYKDITFERPVRQAPLEKTPQEIAVEKTRLELAELALSAPERNQQQIKDRFDVAFGDDARKIAPEVDPRYLGVRPDEFSWASLPSLRVGRSDDPPPIPSADDGPESEGWYQNRVDSINGDAALDKIQDDAFQAAASQSSVVAANGKNVGDKWRTVSVLMDQMRANTAAGKVGLPGGETYDSIPDALGAYASHIGQFISESIITPAEGQEMPSADEARRILDQVKRDAQLESDFGHGRLEVPPKEPGPMDAVWAHTKNAFRSVVEVGSFMWLAGGVRDGTQNAIDLMDEYIAQPTGIALGNWFRTMAGKEPLTDEQIKKITEAGLPVRLPEIPEQETMPAQFLRGMAQFVWGFYVGGKTLGLPAQGAALAPSTLVKSFISDFAFFDAQDGRLSDLIQQFPGLSNPITEYLKSDPDDGDAESRLKRGLEGALIAPIIPMTIGTLRVIKRWRAGARTRRMATTTPMPPPDETQLLPAARVTALGDAADDAPIVGKIVDAFDDVAETGMTSEELATRIGQTGKSPLGTTGLYINFARIDGPDDIKAVIDNTSALLKGSVDKSRRGVRKWTTTAAAAEDIDAFKTVMTRREGQALNAEQLVAAGDLWLAADHKLREVADVALKTPTPENLFQFRRMLGIFHAIQKEMLGATAEAGRALNILRRTRGLGAKERAIEIDNAVNMMGGIDANVDLVKMMQAVRAAKGTEGAATFAEKVGGNNLSTNLHAWFLFSILSGPKTQMRNVVSNSGMVALRIAETKVAERVGAILNTQDPTIAGQAAAQWTAVKDGWLNALAAAGHMYRTGQSKFYPGGTVGKWGARPEAMSRDSWFMRNTGMVGRATDAVVSYPGRLLLTGDTFFKSIHYDMTAREQAFLTAQKMIASGSLKPSDAAAKISELVENVPESIRIQAMKDANHWTFNDPPGPYLNKLLSMRRMGLRPDDSLGTKLGGYFFRTTVPFILTPRNIWGAGIERSPLAPLVQSYKQAVAAGGGQADLAKTKLALGSMFMATAVDLAQRGDITGAGPDPRSEPGRYALWQRQGRQPYAIRIGDAWYSYRGLEPFSTLFGWGASIGEWMQRSNFEDPDEEFNLEQAVAYSIFSASESMLSASFMQGSADLMAAINDPDSSSAGWLKRYLATYTAPIAVREIGQVNDPYFRFTTNFIEETRKRWGFGGDLPLRRDFYGRPLTGESGVGFLYDLASPFRGRPADEQPIDLEWERLNYAPMNPPKSITVMGQTIKLNGERYPVYERWLELRGATKPSEMGEMGQYLLDPFGDRTMLETLNMIVTGQHPLSGDYQDVPDAKKPDFLRSVISGYSRVAKAIILEENPELLQIAQERNLRDLERGEIEPTIEDAEAIPLPQ